MAVQQNKPTRSKRGMRRSHDALTAVTGRRRYLDTSNPGVRCHGRGFWPFRDSACSIAGTEF